MQINTINNFGERKNVENSVNSKNAHLLRHLANSTNKYYEEASGRIFNIQTGAGDLTS